MIVLKLTQKVYKWTASDLSSVRQDSEGDTMSEAIGTWVLRNPRVAISIEIVNDSEAEKSREIIDKLSRRISEVRIPIPGEESPGLLEELKAAKDRIEYLQGTIGK